MNRTVGFRSLDSRFDLPIWIAYRPLESPRNPLHNRIDTPFTPHIRIPHPPDLSTLPKPPSAHLPILLT